MTVTVTGLVDCDNNSELVDSDNISELIDSDRAG